MAANRPNVFDGQHPTIADKAFGGVLQERLRSKFAGKPLASVADEAAIVIADTFRTWIANPKVWEDYSHTDLLDLSSMMAEVYGIHAELPYGP